MTRIFIAIAILIIGGVYLFGQETPHQVTPEIEEAAIRMIAEMRHE